MKKETNARTREGLRDRASASPPEGVLIRVENIEINWKRVAASFLTVIFKEEIEDILKVIEKGRVK